MYFIENFVILLDLLVVNNKDVIEFLGVGDNIFLSNIRYYCLIFCVLKLLKFYIRIYKRKFLFFLNIDF